MGYTVTISIVYSIFNILNAITTKYRFLAKKHEILEI